MLSEFRPERAWWDRLFQTIDAGDADGFVTFLTADARFRFANAAEVMGSAAIRAATAAFFRSIARSRHEAARIWHGSGSSVCEGRVTYTRHDGSVLTCPFVNVFDWRGELIADYRIYIDISALFAKDAEVSHDSALSDRTR